jgi:hypothetical protein
MIDGLFKLNKTRTFSKKDDEYKGSKNIEKTTIELKSKEDQIREFMYMRVAKGKKNEVFDLLHRSKWTKHTSNEDIETSTK